MTNERMTPRHRLLGTLAIVLGLTLACSSKLATNVPPSDGAVDLSSVLQQAPCGGTVSLQGITPSGPFNGDVVSLYGLYGQYEAVAVSIADESSGLGIQWEYSWAPGDAGALLAPENVTVNAKFLIDHGNSQVALAGNVDITSATNPAAAADAGGGGAVTASMTFSQTGFDLSGTMSSSYCRVYSDTSGRAEHR
jgi:hypothetical protein